MLLYNDIKLKDFPCGVALKKVTKLKAFSQEYSQTVEALPGVSSVEFFGSVANGNFVGQTSMSLGNLKPVQLEEDISRYQRLSLI